MVHMGAEAQGSLGGAGYPPTKDRSNLYPQLLRVDLNVIDGIELGKIAGNFLINVSA